MRIIFIRHAESIGNAEGRLQGHADFELSETGRRQAERLFHRFQLERLEPTHIYSSPLRRTAETARIVSRSWKVPIQHRDDLKEYDIGVFSSLTWEEISARYPDMAKAYQKNRNWDVVESAEKLKQRHERGCRVIETMIAGHSNADVVLLFTHGGILQHMLSALMGTDRTWSVGVRNSAVFEFALDKDLWSLEGVSRFNTYHWHIHCFNDTSHLEADYGAAEATGTAMEA